MPGYSAPQPSSLPADVSGEAVAPVASFVPSSVADGAGNWKAPKFEPGNTLAVMDGCWGGEVRWHRETKCRGRRRSYKGVTWIDSEWSYSCARLRGSTINGWPQKSTEPPLVDTDDRH